MFRFKQFAIAQESTPMKVGTDGVLLGAWARIEPTDRRMLDIGTGTGLIALMLAQRAPQARITGIDVIDVKEARTNVAASPWPDRVKVEQCPVQAYHPAAPFDLIVSNPPYFNDSLLPPDAGRTLARHTTELTFTELHDAVVRLLAPDGRFCLVLPPAETDRFLACCQGLWSARRTEVRSTPRRGVRRVLTELTVRPGPPLVTETLTIGTGIHEKYTEEYRALTHEFYLKF